MQVSFSKKELDSFNELFGSQYMDFDRNTSDDQSINKTFDAMSNLQDKMIRSFNKSGHYYLWQLKDRNGGVTDENILKKWGSKAEDSN